VDNEENKEEHKAFLVESGETNVEQSGEDKHDKEDLEEFPVENFKHGIKQINNSLIIGYYAYPVRVLCRRAFTQSALVCGTTRLSGCCPIDLPILCSLSHVNEPYSVSLSVVGHCWMHRCL